MKHGSPLDVKGAMTCYMVTFLDGCYHAQREAKNDPLGPTGHCYLKQHQLDPGNSVHEQKSKWDIGVIPCHSLSLLVPRPPCLRLLVKPVVLSETKQVVSQPVHPARDPAKMDSFICCGLKLTSASLCPGARGKLTSRFWSERDSAVPPHSQAVTVSESPA